MFEFLYDQLQDLTFDLVLGGSIWAVALVLPFRSLAANKEIGWDLIGYFGSAVFGTILVILLEDPFLDWSDGQIPELHAAIDGYPWLTVLLLNLIVSDFGAYWAHRLLHTRYLWDTHAWHHSPKYLYFISGSRGSPLHLLVLGAPYTLTYVIFPIPIATFVTLLNAAIQVGNQHFIHSNLWVPFARHLEYVLVTPRFHFIHHSRNRAYSDSNYGFMFSVWDRWFGTFTDPSTFPSDEPLGLSYEVSYTRAFLGLPPSRS